MLVGGITLEKKHFFVFVFVSILFQNFLKLLFPYNSFFPSRIGRSRGKCIDRFDVLRMFTSCHWVATSRSKCFQKGFNGLMFVCSLAFHHMSNVSVTIIIGISLTLFHFFLFCFMFSSSRIKKAATKINVQLKKTAQVLVFTSWSTFRLS